MFCKCLHWIQTRRRRRSAKNNAQFFPWQADPSRNIQQFAIATIYLVKCVRVCDLQIYTRKALSRFMCKNANIAKTVMITLWQEKIVSHQSLNATRCIAAVRPRFASCDRWCLPALLSCTLLSSSAGDYTQPLRKLHDN